MKPKKFRMKLWRGKRGRKRRDSEKGDLTEKHTPIGKQPTDTRGKDYTPLFKGAMNCSTRVFF